MRVFSFGVAPEKGVHETNKEHEHATQSLLGCHRAGPCRCEPHWHTPTLVIHGDADAVMPLELGQCLADAVPNASMAVMPGGSHAANHTNPDECNAAIIAFAKLSN